MINRRASLAYESEIVWEEDITLLPYVREGYVFTRTCDEPVPVPSVAERRVGFAVHASRGDEALAAGVDARARRVFYLKPHDRAVAPDDVYATRWPCEAVDPRTVAPGVPGKMTARARGQNGDAVGEGGEGT